MDLEYQKTEIAGEDTYVFSGSINQNSESVLSYLFLKVITDNCTFDLEKIASVDSYGVRAWIGFIQKITQKFRIRFVKCNVNVVQQMNMISEFTGQAEVNSVIGEYECVSCGHQHLELFEKGRNLPEHPEAELSELKCSECGSELEMDCLEEEFFHWLDAG